MSEKSRKLRERIVTKKVTLKREKTTLMDEDIWVWELGAKQRDQYEQSRWTVDKKGKPKVDMANTRAKLLVLCCRESGEDGASKVFVEDDEHFIGGMPAGEVDRVFEIAMQLSGLKAVDDDDEEKKSLPTEKSSSADSPTTSDGPASTTASNA